MADTNKTLTLTQTEQATLLNALAQAESIAARASKNTKTPGVAKCHLDQQVLIRGLMGKLS